MKNHDLRLRCLFLALAALCALLLFAGCLEREEAKKISLGERVQLGAQSQNEAIKIGIAAIVSPEESLIYYQEIFDYISKKIGRPVEPVRRRTYQEMNELVKKGYVDAAFVCSLPYVEGHDSFGMELLVAPVINGETTYYSYTIVPADSNVSSFKELRGKRFAFADPLSNSGYLVPNYMLAKMSENPDTFFSYYIFTYSHDRTIKAVADKVVDGANVDSLIGDYLNVTNPGLTARTKIIQKSPPYGMPPVVVPRNLDAKRREQLKQAFLRMHEDEEGRKILRKVMIDKFVTVDDSAYDSVREMNSWLKAKYGK